MYGKQFNGESVANYSITLNMLNMYRNDKFKTNVFRIKENQFCVILDSKFSISNISIT